MLGIGGEYVLLGHPSSPKPVLLSQSLGGRLGCKPDPSSRKIQAEACRGRLLCQGSASAAQYQENKIV